MNRRPYRATQPLQERLSDEFHRNGSDHRLRIAERGRFTRHSPIDGRVDDGQKQRAREMASDAFDEMADKSAKSIDRTNRKRRLIDGPGEFRDLRVDRTTIE
jgi:hypothetical protein